MGALICRALVSATAIAASAILILNDHGFWGAVFLIVALWVVGG